MLEQQWSALHFGELKQETDSEQHVLEVQDYLDDLDPAAVQVELYANGANGNAAERITMVRVRQLVGAINGYAYRTEVPATRPATDYTVHLYPTTMAWRYLWKMRISCGNANSIDRIRLQ